jgi:hypothetical protein
VEEDSTRQYVCTVAEKKLTESRSTDASFVVLELREGVIRGRFLGKLSLLSVTIVAAVVGFVEFHGVARSTRHSILCWHNTLC